MHLRATRTLLVEPKLPVALQALHELAYNLFWTWNTDTAALFERLDTVLWAETRHNPVQLLQQLPLSTLERAAEILDRLAEEDR